MREIKYRVWDKAGKKMIKFDELVIYPDGTYSVRFGGWAGENFCYELDEHMAELIPFTGMKDVKGVEIYEGDILETSGGTRYGMKWREDLGCSCCEDGVGYYKPGGDVVIGNIWENPELLEGKNDEKDCK